MIKVLKNLLSVTINPDLNEYHFTSNDGTLIISIKDFNIIHFNYIFQDITITPEALYGSSFISKNYIANTDFNFIEDAPLREDSSYFVITIKSALVIKIEKSTALISIYKDNVLIHGGKIKDEVSALSSFQLKVLIAKGDESFVSKFMFRLDMGDEFYGMSDKVIPLYKSLSNSEYYIKNSILQDYLSNSNAFLIKRNKCGKVCGILFDQCSIGKMNFGIENYSISSNDSPLSYYFFDGFNYKDVLSSYYDVIGYPALLPLFTFGYFASFMSAAATKTTVDRILEFFNKTEEYQIPCEGLYDFVKYINDSDKLPQYNNYIKELCERDYHIAMTLKPTMLINHDWYKMLDRRGYFIKDEFGNSYVFPSRLGDVSYIDFTNKDACNWWKLQLKDYLLNSDCLGIWYNSNEFEIEDPGVPLKKIKSILSIKMSQASSDAFDEANVMGNKKRHWITPRANYLRCISRENIKDASKKSLTNELLLRLIESEVLKTSLVIQPLLELHSGKSLNYIMVLPLVINLIKQHYTFLPYIYNVAYEEHSKGLPLDRLLCMEFNDERIDFNTQDCLFGNSILKVVVAEEGVTKREVYLPKDTHWYNAANKKFYYGGANVVIDASPGTFNYFVKEGSIIELNMDKGKRLKTGLFKNLDLKIYRIKDNKSTVSQYFEDDGQTHLDENKFNLYKFELTKRRFIITKIKCAIKDYGRIFNVCNETGNRIASFDPDKLEEGESVSYRL